MAVVEDVRDLGAGLERSYEVYVRGRLKFRVGQLVYVAFSLDETVMGFAFPKEERAALVGGDPVKFQMPSPSLMSVSIGSTRILRHWNRLRPVSLSSTLGAWSSR